MGYYSLLKKLPRLVKEKEARKQAGYSKEEGDLSRLLQKQPGFKSSIEFDEFKKLQDYAGGTADSPQYQLLKQQAQTQGLQEMSDMGAQAQSGLSNVYNQLGMGGGLSSGARERLAGSAGTEGLLAAQKARAGQAGRMQGLGIEQEQQRGKAMESVLGAKQGDIQAQNNFAQDQYKMQTEAQMALKKSQAERDIAAMNACFANGTIILRENGTKAKIEDIKVGDLVKGGVVYTIQQSLAPSKIYAYEGTYLTSGHAVFEKGEWKRVKHSEQGIEIETPEHVQYIYNLGVTDHYVKTSNGVTFGDLHETDDYEFLTDEESLEAMNKAWQVEGYDELSLR